MKIPVFVSCPTALSEQQRHARRRIVQHLRALQLEARALGRSDYPTKYPLQEVAVIANHCSGGLILGFEQFRAKRGTWKRGTPEKRRIEEGKCARFPTPWNQLEAGILFGLQLPMLIFREEGVEGGVFDAGVTDVFVQDMPMGALSRKRKRALREVFLKWRGHVAEHYDRL